MIVVKRTSPGVYESPCGRIKVVKHIVTSSIPRGKRGSAAEISWEPFIDGVSCRFDQLTLKDAVMIANRRIKEAEQRPDPILSNETTVTVTLPEPATATPITVPATVPSRTTRDGQYRSPPAGDQYGSAPLTYDSPLAAKLASARAAHPADDSPHVIVEARAGTGKTTTLIEGLKELLGPGSTLTPSPQQLAVWDAICLSKGKVRTVCFVAFNKSIAEELKRRVPSGCEASTMHGMGYKAVNRAFAGRRINVDEHRVEDIVLTMLGIGPKPVLEAKTTAAQERQHKAEVRSWFDAKLRKQAVIGATEKLVGLCKMNLTDAEDTDALAELASHYDVDCNGEQREIFGLVPRVLEECRNVTDRIDFDDMIWLPVTLKLPVFRYDLLLIDERQDLNKCQMQLALRAGKRIVAVGDERQSIYGFAGADSDACTNFRTLLEETGREVVQIPLTVTRRCGKAIVREAQRIVPDFEAHETCCEGFIRRLTFAKTSCEHCRGTGHEPYTDREGLTHYGPNDLCQNCDVCYGQGTTEYDWHVQDGDMVLCRTNAPLVSACFGFIKRGRRANIQGRDIGQGLISTVTKLKTRTVADLITRLDQWLANETRKENARKHPSETKLAAIQDRRDCILCFTDGLDSTASPEEVVAKIQAVFTDSKQKVGIRLSSIHKAKGLEAKRVFILQPPMSGPRRDKMKSWELKQEENIRYVSITRAIEELCYVS